TVALVAAEVDLVAAVILPHDDEAAGAEARNRGIRLVTVRVDDDRAGHLVAILVEHARADADIAPEAARVADDEAAVGQRGDARLGVVKQVVGVDREIASE